MSNYFYVIIIAVIFVAVIVGGVLRKEREDEQKRNNIEVKIDLINKKVSHNKSDGDIKVNLPKKEDVDLDGIKKFTYFPRVLTPKEIKDTAEKDEVLEGFTVLSIAAWPVPKDDDDLFYTTINFMGKYKVVFRRGTVAFLGEGINSKMVKGLVVDFIKVKEPKNPVPFRYRGVTQTSFTIQKGKMYRVFDKIFSAEDLPIALSDGMKESTFDSAIITQVGVVSGLEYSTQGNPDEDYIYISDDAVLKGKGGN